MLIKIRRGWEMPEREATPEHVYMNRREILKAAGLSLTAGPLAQAAVEGTSLYPAKLNPKFTKDQLGRPVTQNTSVRLPSGSKK